MHTNIVFIGSEQPAFLIFGVLSLDLHRFGQGQLLSLRFVPHSDLLLQLLQKLRLIGNDLYVKSEVISLEVFLIIDEHPVCHAIFDFALSLESLPE